MPHRQLDHMERPDLDAAFREPLDEERIPMDPDTRDWDGAQEAVVEPDAYAISEVRLSDDELTRIERAATTQGMSANAYLRYAALSSALQHASN